jgi:hypothetical protein
MASWRTSARIHARKSYAAWSSAALLDGNTQRARMSSKQFLFFDALLD